LILYAKERLRAVRGVFLFIGALKDIKVIIGAGFIVVAIDIDSAVKGYDQAAHFKGASYLGSRAAQDLPHAFQPSFSCD